MGPAPSISLARIEQARTVIDPVFLEIEFVKVLVDILSIAKMEEFQAAKFNDVTKILYRGVPARSVAKSQKAKPDLIVISVSFPNFPRNFPDAVDDLVRACEVFLNRGDHLR